VIVGPPKRSKHRPKTQARRKSTKSMRLV
jgi:hypothetical protein